MKEKYCQFKLQDRVHKHSSTEVTDWVTGNDAYYIKCSNRRFARASYLAVKKVPDKESTEEDAKTAFITTCVPSIGHCGEDMFMLFRLHHPSPTRSRLEQIKDISAKLENACKTTSQYFCE